MTREDILKQEWNRLVAKDSDIERIRQILPKSTGLSGFIDLLIVDCLTDFFKQCEPLGFIEVVKRQDIK